MGNFLFYTDIKQFLTEEEQIQQSQQQNDKRSGFHVQVWPTWKKEVVNGKPQKVRRLSFYFNNVPADIAQTIVEKNGLTPNYDMPSKDYSTYTLGYNCKNFNSPGDKLWMKIQRVIQILQGNGLPIPNLQEMVNEIPTEEDLVRTEKLANEKWQEMYQEFSEGELNNLVEKFMKIFGKVYQQMYGWQLSFQNAKLIIAQKPDATMVLTKRIWEDYLDRTVNPGATPILYYIKPSNVKGTEHNFGKLKGAADVAGLPFNNDKEYTGHGKWGFALSASKEFEGYLPMFGYDISDTTQIHSDYDKVQSTYGMINNLTGEPNDMTRDFMEKLYPTDDANKAEYEEIRSLINDNAKLYYTILIGNLKRMGDTSRESFISNLEKKGSEPNADYATLLANAVRGLADSKLESEYKIANPRLRLPSRTRITGMVLYMCGVWNRDTISSLFGKKVDKQTLVQDSNIINDLMGLLEAGRNEYLRKLKKAVSNAHVPNEKEGEQVNEGILNKMSYCTPEMLAQTLQLQIIDNEPTQGEKTPINELYDNKEGLTVDDFKDPANKTFDKDTQQEYICGFPVIYQVTGHSNLDSIFKSGHDRSFTGSKGGNMYGPGTYSTYKLASTEKNVKHGNYGDTFLKMLVLSKFKDFLICDKELAKKVHGENWPIAKQMYMFFGPEKCEEFKRRGIWDSIVHLHEKTSSNMLEVWRQIGDKELVKAGVNGFVFFGGHDGFVSVVRDFKDTLPIAYSTDRGRTWKNDKFTQDTINTVFYNVDFNTYLGKDIDKFNNTKDMDSALNKRINGLVLAKVGNKYNFVDVNTHRTISPLINFDTASPVRDNGLAYVTITDPKFVKNYGEPFEGYVSEKGIHYDNDPDDYTPWNEFNQYLKTIGY